MPILGLMHSEQFTAERYKNVRRSVYYFYPNGASPLMGILSLLKEEVTNDPEFQWFESRMDLQTTATAAIATNIALYSSVSADFATWTTAAANVTLTAGTQYGLKVASVGSLRENQIIKFGVTIGGVVTEALGRITRVDTANVRVAFVATRTLAAATFDTATNIGVEVLVVGSAHSEGQVGTSTAPYNLPINPKNYTQIFRTGFQITGTAMKTSARFDKSGIYPDQSEQSSIQHMIEMEKAFLFGDALQVAGAAAPIRYTGGILYHLRQWEAVNSIYRGGAGAPAVTSNADDAKRIINLTDGFLTHKIYSNYLERLFRFTANQANEKLVLCGSGFLNVINQMYESRAQLTVNPPTKETFGMNVVSHLTPFGTVHYKTHPLFSQNVTMRNSALFLDVNNLKYRYLAGRDTELLDDRQPNNADYLEKEWLTECGLEVVQPESHMYLSNVQDFRA